MHSCEDGHLAIGLPCELTKSAAPHRTAISDSEEHYDDEENLKKGVEEAEDVNGTKGETKMILCKYLYMFLV